MKTIKTESMLYATVIENLYTTNNFYYFILSLIFS